MKIYTRTGDDGDTGLFGGPRVRKDDLRIEAYGTVDELNATLGVARTSHLPADLDAIVQRIQNELFDVGAELATPDPQAMGTKLIGNAHIDAMEQAIDRANEELEPLQQFILPGGTTASAHLHLARVICRRAERRVITLSDKATISSELLRYLNRLSDLLFVLARLANFRENVPDIPWQGPHDRA